MGGSVKWGFKLDCLLVCCRPQKRCDERFNRVQSGHIQREREGNFERLFERGIDCCPEQVKGSKIVGIETPCQGSAVLV